MSATNASNGELNERMARIEAQFAARDKLDTAAAHAIDVRFRAAEKSVETALASAEKAVTKAETASEKRFEGVNEFRSTLSDQQRTLMPRAESEGLHKATNEKVDRLAAAIGIRIDQGATTQSEKTEAVSKSLSEKIDASAKSQGARLEQVNQIMGEKVDRFGAGLMALQTLVSGLNLRREGSAEGKKEGYGWIAAMIAGALALAGFFMRR